MTLAADALGIVDTPVDAGVTASGEFDHAVGARRHRGRGAARRRGARPAAFLERVWSEIGGLPVRQRVALLLNLAGPASQDMLSLMPATGIASWAQIAAALEMDAARLQALVPGLPHDDHTIADAAAGHPPPGHQPAQVRAGAPGPAARLRARIAHGSRAMTGTPRDDLARLHPRRAAGAADGREDVAYEQIEAYVDGALDDVDREIFETRLADDPGLRAMVEDLRALRPALAPATASPARVVPFEPRADAGAARQTPGRSTALALAAAGRARRGGSGGPAPVAAVDAGSGAAVAGAAAAAAAAAAGAARPARAGRSRVAGADGGAAGRRPHRRADERRDAGRLRPASAVICSPA